MYLTPIHIQFESSSSNPLFLLIKQSRMTSRILKKCGGLGSRADSAAKCKGFSSLGPVFPSPLFAFKAGSLPSLGFLGHWALPLQASLDTLRWRGAREPKRNTRASLSSTLPIWIYHGGNNNSMCKKQLLPRGLQHPRTKISLTNLIYFPVCVPEVWKELLKLLLFKHFYGPGGKNIYHIEYMHFTLWHFEIQPYHL